MPEPVDQLSRTLGFRAPHLPTATSSTWDFPGHGWVLFGAGGWRDAAGAVRAETGIALAHRERGADFDDPGDVFGLGDGGASLVRPDGIVAWRSASGVADPVGPLWDVLARVLSR